MKYSVLTILVVCFFSLETFSQNSSYYQTIPGNNNLLVYKQLNLNPYVFKNGTLIGESVLPNWYKGLMFNNNPGTFPNYTELYTYLVDDSRFVESPLVQGSYYNKSSQTVQSTYYQTSKSKLNSSISYSNDQAYLDSNPTETSRFGRYTTIYQEVYFKYLGEEFLILVTSNLMVDMPNNIPNNTERQKRVNFLKGSNQYFTTYEEAGLRISLLFKESGNWKWIPSPNLAYTYFTNENLNTIMASVLQRNESSIDVESSIVNAIRVYVEN